MYINEQQLKFEVTNRTTNCHKSQTQGKTVCIK